MGKTKNSNNYLTDLIRYVDNGYHVADDRAAVFGEIDYPEHINEVIRELNLKTGDIIRVCYRTLPLEENEINEVQGTFLELMSLSSRESIKEIVMLSSGKSVWKSMKNFKIITNEYILSIKKIKDAPADFDKAKIGYSFHSECVKTNTAFVDEWEKENIKKEKSVNQNELIPLLNKSFPGTTSETVWLFLHMKLFWECVQKPTGAQVMIMTKNHNHKCINTLKVTTPYSNQKVHLLKSTKPIHGAVPCPDLANFLIIPFADVSQLNQISKIMIKWDIDCDLSIISVIRPKFITTVDPIYNIYNIQTYNTSLQTLRYYLTHSTNAGIAESVKEDYKMICRLLPERDSFVMIKNDYMDDYADKLMVDVLNFINNNDYNEKGKRNYDIFVENRKIEPTIIPKNY